MGKSVQAQAAAQIKSKLKAIGVKAQVKSYQAAGCNGVYVWCNEADMSKKDEIDKAAMVHQYGRFNGMEDIYEFTNMNDHIPQVMFVSVSYH